MRRMIRKRAPTMETPHSSSDPRIYIMIVHWCYMSCLMCMFAVFLHTVKLTIILFSVLTRIYRPKGTNNIS